MATVLKVNINDLNSQFFYDLGQKVSDSAEIEIRIPEKKPKIEIFSDVDFWQIIGLFDWSKEGADEIMAPAIKKLADMPVVNIYLFADKLSEKLHQLDTRLHGEAYLKNEDEDCLSVDDFLYVRCAVVAEGKAYFDKVLENPSEFPADLSFEPILNLPDQAYELKTGRVFEYFPAVSYETYSNKKAWN
ncbi:MAG TPA: DUF4240 domain-containing protein [Saprospiraceae bacterium]|nr:DUF4240 domain-containing protein [Saprospiraceae bacterium]